MPFAILRQFHRNEDAAVGIMMGAGAALLSGACALGVDLGMIYLAKRDLQNAADAAAIAAVETLETGADAAVQELIVRRGDDDIIIKSISNREI